MAWTITVEGDPQAVPVEDGQTILDALLEHGVGFAYSCQAGNCGTCKCEYVGGEIAELEYSEHALSAAERSRGTILACRTQAWGDVSIRRLSSEEFVMHPSRIMQCRVEALEHLTHDVLRLSLSVQSGGPYTFSAGQFAKLQFPFAPDVPRDYSMANRADEPGLEFHIRCITGGVSGRIPTQVKTGDSIRVSGPFGTSYLREQHPGPILAIAGGTGLAPMRSIVSTALAQDAKRPVHLYFGVRGERDIYGAAELEQWQVRYPNFKVHIVLSEERSSARRFGMVTDAVQADFDTLAGFHAYLAGPPVMVDAATPLLLQGGVPARDIHADAFYSAVDAPAASVSA
jgi:CDP-4-dehydro-6-deoxyglucose reductase/ferredoxin-NAD(P)+ reductase (naphthalene dioxygenase ferredoxin-specific)